MVMLFICWVSLYGTCIAEETHGYMMPYVAGQPSHFKCATAIHLWIDEHSGKGVEPDYIECIRG